MNYYECPIGFFKFLFWRYRYTVVCIEICRQVIFRKRANTDRAVVTNIYAGATTIQKREVNAKCVRMDNPMLLKLQPVSVIAKHALKGNTQQETLAKNVRKERSRRVNMTTV